jgi:hypothetical protein
VPPGYNGRVKFRRLLFAALLAVGFDVAVPLELSAQGGLVWEDDEEQAVRAEKRRQAAAEKHAVAPRRETVAARAHLTTRRPRVGRATRRVRVRRTVRVTAPPPPSSPTEDH